MVRVLELLSRKHWKEMGMRAVIRRDKESGAVEKADSGSRANEMDGCVPRLRAYAGRAVGGAAAAVAPVGHGSGSVRARAPCCDLAEIRQEGSARLSRWLRGVVEEPRHLETHASANAIDNAAGCQ